MAKTNPFIDMDITKILGDFRAPGIDLEAIMNAHRKNLEAFTAAQQVIFDGMQAYARRYSEILRQTMEQTSAITSEMINTGTPEEKIAKQAEMMKASYEKALANLKELVEVVTKSNSEAVEVINKRVTESLEELKAAMEKAKK